MNRWVCSQTAKILDDAMSLMLGVDLGGTSLDFALANANGDFLVEKSYKSPFLQIPEFGAHVNKELENVRPEERAHKYLADRELEFFQEADSVMGSHKIMGKGYSLCGKTWEQDGKIFIMGGNTSSSLAVHCGNGNHGILIADLKAERNPQIRRYYEDDCRIAASNDANAAANAQGIYYQAEEGIDPAETGYFVLGTGFGFGVPKCIAPTEIGHIPVGFIPKALWQECGCTEGHKTACAENFASGRGILKCAEILLSIRDESVLHGLSACADGEGDNPDLFALAQNSKLRNQKSVSAKMVMEFAKDNADGLAAYVVSLAARVTAYSAITAAQLFGLQRIGVGESVARANPWHVDNISRMVETYVQGSALLGPAFKVESTPVEDPAKYGALSLVVPESRYAAWAKKMRRSSISETLNNP